jgi:hypothetical protein
MSNIQQEDTRGILNETRMTIHKHEMGGEEFQTMCGLTYHLGHGQLQTVRIKRAIREFDAEKCGRCFEEGRGY